MDRTVVELWELERTDALNGLRRGAGLEPLVVSRPFTEAVDEMLWQGWRTKLSWSWSSYVGDSRW